MFGATAAPMRTSGRSCAKLNSSFAHDLVRPACAGPRRTGTMNRDRTHFLFLNVGHFLDHLFTLIFATVAALALSARMGAQLRRTAQIRDARLLRLRGVLLSGRLARRQMEPRRHDGGVLRRHRARVGRDRIRPDAVAGRHRAVRDRHVRGDLSSGRPRDGDAEMAEHRHAARGERRVGQPRRRERRADHRLPDRQWRLAHGVHHPGRLLGRGRHRLRARAARARFPPSDARRSRCGGIARPRTTGRCCCACR